MRILLIVLLGITSVFAQENKDQDASVLALKSKEKDTLYRANYPEGVYVTKQDFIAKKPTTSKVVEMRDLQKQPAKQILHNPYFYYQKELKKVKNVFAISYKGHLYFQLKAILKNRNKTDRAQSANYHNTFVRVILGGENYLYTEAELVNKWAAGTAVNFGLAGIIMLHNDLIKGKGIVWDVKNQEFNIFKSCKDYNAFITDKAPQDVQVCKKHQPDMLKVRQTIAKIK